MVEAIGKIVAYHDFTEFVYQGDSIVAVQAEDGRYGLVGYGWGSCSGCDALQSCDSYEDLAYLYDSLYAGTQWFDSAVALNNYITNRDWEFYIDGRPGDEFFEKVKALADGEQDG